MTWLRFCEEQRGRPVWAATSADVAAYHHARRLAPGTTRVASSTWDRSIGALSKFYRWAHDRGDVAEVPFAYRSRTAERGRRGHRLAGEVNLAMERQGRRGPPGFLSLDDYVAFREVGLRGRTPDGSADPSFMGAPPSATWPSPSC